MTNIQTLVMHLVKSLSDSDQDYILYLDNLFPTVPLVNALGQLEIEVMRTT